MSLTPEEKTKLFSTMAVIKVNGENSLKKLEEHDDRFRNQSRKIASNTNFRFICYGLGGFIGISLALYKTFVV